MAESARLMVKALGSKLLLGTVLFEAPLLDWSAVSSRREFTPHPLGDNKVRGGHVVWRGESMDAFTI